MRTKIGSMLLISAIMLIGAASFAKESDTPVKQETSIVQDYSTSLAVANIYVAVDVYTGAIYFENIGAAETLSTFAQADYCSDYRPIPTPRNKKLKTKRLARKILKHPSNI